MSKHVKTAVGFAVAAGLILVGYRQCLKVQCRSHMLNHEYDRFQQAIRSSPSLGPGMLCEAYAAQDKIAFERVLQTDVGVDGIEYGRFTLVHETAGNADSYWLEKLLEHGANPDFDDVVREVRPIQIAIEQNHAKNVRLLIESGADLDAITFREMTLLRKAWGMRHGEIVMTLLDAGAKFNPPSVRTKSFIQFFQRLAPEAYPQNEAEKRDEEHLGAVRQWFRERNLDLMNATWDESQGDSGVWTIPAFRSEEE